MLDIDHVHFIVVDLEKSISFFEMLGLELVKRTGHGGKSCFMRIPSSNAILELQEARVFENPGLAHIAFQVESLKPFIDMLVSNGFPVDGPVRNKFTDRNLITTRDNNGFLWQFVEKED
jgi:catechol 2,3-dioxygenase-like lactoylglutathione lyase family enzyme